MYIVELIYPGASLQGLEDDAEDQITTLLYQLETSLVDASLALTLFEGEQNRPRVSIRKEVEEDAARERRIRASYEQQLPSNLSEVEKWRALAGMSDQIELEAKYQKWVSGRLPSQYRSRLRILHARSFVYALDLIDKLLRLLVKIPGVPAGVAGHRARFIEAIPHLRAVRDSAVHVEDRARRKGRIKGRDVEISSLPIMNEAISAPAGKLLMVDAIIGNRYGSTTASGEYGEVEVSQQTLGLAHETIQAVINEFRWVGPPRRTPL
jgi:hypothetical protein